MLFVIPAKAGIQNGFMGNDMIREKKVFYATCDNCVTPFVDFDSKRLKEYFREVALIVDLARNGWMAGDNKKIYCGGCAQKLGLVNAKSDNRCVIESLVTDNA